MADELVSALLKGHDLRILAVLTADVARHARSIQRMAPTSAALLAQGLTSAALLGALQKEQTRINVQLECDGPLRGFLADSDGQGTVRGYAKNNAVELPEASGAFRWRPALGNAGFLSVLRDLGEGEYYRSSVELQAFDVASDLNHYFKKSEQIETAVGIEVIPQGNEPLGIVAGLLIQCLPNGSPEELAALKETLFIEGGFRKALETTQPLTASALLTHLVPRPDLEVMSRFPVRYVCGCSVERVKRALAALGKEGLEDLLAKEGKADATCEFCMTHYVVEAEEIRALLTGFSESDVD
ncbi:MAG: Hsp33 family molecular chaperone HslO [Myxococcaceae bacterium]